MNTNEQPTPQSYRKDKGFALFQSGLVVKPSGINPRKVYEQFKQGRFEILVRSETEPDRYYRAGKMTCNCPDFVHRYSQGDDGRCKHQYAAAYALLEWIGLEEVKAVADDYHLERWDRLDQGTQREMIDREVVPDWFQIIDADMKTWPLTIQWPEPRFLPDEEYVEWRCAHSGESAHRDAHGNWEFIPVTDW